MQVGLVGCGSWGQFILRDLRSLGCRVAVVARSAESRARADGAAVVVESIGELPEVDGIVVAARFLDIARILSRSAHPFD